MAKAFWDRNTSTRDKRRIKDIVQATGADEKAMTILINAYCDFDIGNSRSPDSPTKVPKKDLAYAIEKGVMMPNEKLTHDQMVKRLVKLRDGLDRQQVANAFVISISNNRLDYRSALACYAYHRLFPNHKLKRETTTSHSNQERVYCAKCRHAWSANEPEAEIEFNLWRLYSLFLGGGVNHCIIEYATAEFTWFAKENPPQPTKDQWKAFGDVLDALRALPESAQLGELEKSLTGKIKGDKYARQLVLEILGFCGILQPASQPNVLEHWITDIPKELHPSYYKNEWSYPLPWWTGADGVNEQAVALWFPELAR